jgi:hypothetical protein
MTAYPEMLVKTKGRISTTRIQPAMSMKTGELPRFHGTPLKRKEISVNRHRRTSANGRNRLVRPSGVAFPPEFPKFILGREAGIISNYVFRAKTRCTRRDRVP